VLRSVLAAAISVVSLSGPAPAPAYASHSADDPLAALPYHPEWGTVTGQPAVLRRGCHWYLFDYTITPPEGIWAMEVFISGPGLRHLAAGGFLDGSDPLTGTGRYKLCRATTHSGLFSIVGKVSTDDGAGHLTEGRIAVDTYRLRRPPRHHR
jgi:hypothetical protein